MDMSSAMSTWASRQTDCRMILFCPAWFNRPSMGPFYMVDAGEG